MRVIKTISLVLKMLTVLFLTALIVVVMIQVIGRYSPLSFVWTEELSRFLFIFAVSFAAPIAMEKREYVRVDVLLELLPDKIRKYYDAAIYLLIAIFLCYIIPFAYKFTMIGQGQTSSTMAISMPFIFSSTIITYVFIALFCFVNIYRLFTEKEEEGAKN